MKFLLLAVILNWNLLSICGDNKDWWETTVVSFHLKLKLRQRTFVMLIEFFVAFFSCDSFIKFILGVLLIATEMELAI